jgi:hypothetical protein
VLFQDQQIENKVVNSRSFGCEVLEAVKVRPPGFVQGNDFAVDEAAPATVKNG